MNTTILRLFLESNLFNIEIDDPTFDKLNKAVDSLLNKELKKKTEVLRFALVAIDSNISYDDPVLMIIKEHVTKKSQTILSKSKDSPTTLLRAIALEALWKLSQKDLTCARIVWLVGSSFVSHYSFGREESLIVDKFLNEIGEHVETAAKKEWTISQPKLIQPKLTPSDTSPVKISSFTDPTDIGEILNAVPITAGNYQNHHSYFNQWKILYGPAIGKEISDSFNRLSKAQSKNVQTAFSKFTEELAESTSSAQEYLINIGEQMSATNQAISNRSQLLWWKEAMYSISQKKSYRDVESILLPIIMAFDLYEQITTIYPVSIDYFLMETISKISQEDQKMSFEALIESINKSESKEALANLFFKKETIDGRIGLLEFIRNVLFDGMEISELKNRVGLDPKKELSVLEFSVWMFHELQANRLATSK
jgi:hypothetical protein